MELENIVANTVYIKARESKFWGVVWALALAGEVVFASLTSPSLPATFKFEERKY